jgi:hypothetical protein
MLGLVEPFLLSVLFSDGLQGIGGLLR